MSKRRYSRDSSIVANGTPAKRTKFTLDNIAIPDVDVEGVVLVTGAGDVGQLGLGPDVLEKSRPALVKLNHTVIDVCAGGMHTVCLTKEGKVLTFGCNDEGALGRRTDGIEDAEFLAGEVQLPGKAIQITAGDSHSAALLDDGRVFAWGTFRDSHGSMGLTPKGIESDPYEIIKDVVVRKIASGADHMAFLTKTGDIFTCGCPEQGQLGRTTERCSNRNARGSPLVKFLHPQTIKIKPSLKLHFDNVWASSYGTFCKVADTNKIYVCGLNNYNQIGLKQLTPYFTPTLSSDFSKYNWRSITSGQHHTVCLDSGGRVYVIGRKEYGRLGLGKDCEDALELQKLLDLDDKKVVNVACGSATSFAVTDAGELYGWGMGTNGQLGTGSEDDCELPTLIKSKELLNRKVLRVSSGGQHTVILAVGNDTNNRGDS
ncbi:unnamed protein product [Phyllotreta striolata]|uniref:RCC1-like domain-containing protein n=1 Tax=Phyllotreta striolata TaxID=444603 RepID=A0A9N9XKQ0_PHYSR|nr:unnamed protein product [Phyllotreta striolata]